MNQRERYLAIAVGILILLGGGQYIWTKMQRSLDAKYQQIDRLTTQKIQDDQVLTNGYIARESLDKFAKRSLPKDLEAARTTYNEWLIKLSAKSNLRNFKQESSMGSTVMGPAPDGQSGGSMANRPIIYRTLKYSVSGDANLIDAIKLLYAFYEMPYLHRINNLKLTPSKEYGIFLINMGIEVAVLSEAAPQQAAPEIAEFQVMKAPMQKYLDVIAQRNIFAPANVPPQWSRTASASALQNSTFEFELQAKDSDAGQTVGYEIVKSDAEGLQLRDGKLAWTPSKTGKFEVTVRATDTGIPHATSEQTIAINVAEPPPPPKTPEPEPKFDIATQTRVTALVSGRNGPQAWFTSRIEGKTISVNVGDDFDLAGIKAKVVSIGSNYVELESDGLKWTIGQDESLADAYRRGKED